MADALRATGAGEAEFIPHTLTAESRPANGGPGGAVPGMLSPELLVTTPKDGPWFMFGGSFRQFELANINLNTMLKITMGRSRKTLALRHHQLTVLGGDDIGWFPLHNVFAQQPSFWSVLPYPLFFGPNDRFTVQWQDPRPVGAPPPNSELTLTFWGFKALIYEQE